MRPFDVFDYETLSLLVGKAYDKALASVHRRAQAPIVRETMALRILKVAYQGARRSGAMPRLAPLAHGSRRPSVGGFFLFIFHGFRSVVHFVQQQLQESCHHPDVTGPFPSPPPL